MITAIPFIGPCLHKKYCDFFERREIDAVTAVFERCITRIDAATVASPPPADETRLLQKAVDLLNHSQNNSALKKEAGKLERTYFTFLSKRGAALPANYVAKENRDLKETFSRLGISEEFLQTHPEFLAIAKKYFWQHYFPFIHTPVQMVNNELYLPFETVENARTYVMRPWTEIKRLNLDDFRVTYEGFAIGHPDRFSRLAPLKTVDSNDKYAVQFVTSCPTNRQPSPLSFESSGHNFIQIIVPKPGTAEAEVYSVGFYPRKIADIGIRFFKTVPGVDRNHDSNVSRIQAGQVIPIVKQYLFQDDADNNPCLYSLVQNMDAICAALRAQGLDLTPITLETIDSAMRERNEPELDRILITLTEIRNQIVARQLVVPIPRMGRVDKTRLMMQRFEGAPNLLYNTLSSNCTAASYRHEAFAVAFLDAKLDRDRAIQVYGTQRDIRDHKFGIIDRIRDIFERILLHFFAALPLTGLLLGIGSTHPDARHIRSSRPRIIPIPSVVSATASNAFQMLIAPFRPQSQFPAGAIISADNIPIRTPGLWARFKYLLSRDSLLNPDFNIFGE